MSFCLKLKLLCHEKGNCVGFKDLRILESVYVRLIYKASQYFDLVDDSYTLY